MLELEREQMMPMTTPFDGYVEEVGSVRTNCLVSVARNRYSVRANWWGNRSARGCTRRGW